MVTGIVALFLFGGPSLTHLGSLTDELRSPARIAVAPDGSIVVTDAFYDHVARFDANGGLLGTSSVAAGPLGIAAHPDGRFFVLLRETSDEITPSPGDYVIGASVSNHTSNVFLGLIDWISWQAAVDYSGVEEPPVR